MSFALNLLVLLIIGYCGYRGYKNGIIVSVIMLVAIVFSIYFANLLASAYAGDFNGLFRPFAGGLVDKAFSTVMSENYEDEDEKPVVELTNEEKNNVERVSFATLRQLGISKQASEKIAGRVAEDVESVGQRVSESVTNELCSTLGYLIVFAIGFTLVSIAIAVVGNILNLKFTLPGLEKINGGVGAGIGVIQGILLVLLLACAFRYAGVLLPEKKIEGAKLLALFIRKNSIAKMLGI